MAVFSDLRLTASSEMERYIALSASSVESQCVCVQVVHDGRLSAMKHGKSDVSEARKETECGLSFSSSSVQWREGDKVVAYTTRRVPPTLLWDFGF